MKEIEQRDEKDLMHVIIQKLTKCLKLPLEHYHRLNLQPETKHVGKWEHQVISRSINMLEIRWHPSAELDGKVSQCPAFVYIDMLFWS
ncbi:hypothetical protein EUGRSUZ_C01829 [Eucalyptus grandis]|uniref:Uncharacterized protein n=2 Tax=Eucalyptus grandis TaxID=71139 RepID=A0ACC3LDC2_EUCGR|nr:hypothetical protein EUGRSUZ_C01829 [Eucalyptus grandis]